MSLGKKGGLGSSSEISKSGRRKATPIKRQLSSDSASVAKRVTL